MVGLLVAKDVAVFWVLFAPALTCQDFKVLSGKKRQPTFVAHSVYGKVRKLQVSYGKVTQTNWRELVKSYAPAISVAWNKSVLVESWP